MQTYSPQAASESLPCPFGDADSPPSSPRHGDHVVPHPANASNILLDDAASDSLSSHLKHMHMISSSTVQHGASSASSSHNMPNSPSTTQPASTNDPTSLSEASSRMKKVNPFVDLLETEAVYVDTLSGVIRKVAAAWSRSNLPPPELDQMFRAVESVFKANRLFLTRLKEIGASPSSPRVIGDLLMKWLDQLEAPYSNYCSSYLTGFNEWEPVRSNPRLKPQLEAFSVSIVPPDNATCWTLDDLLSLPRNRIRYYLKLYSRLLKNSAAGKSTDKKLLEAVAKLENLWSIAEEKSKVSLTRTNPSSSSVDEDVVDIRESDRDLADPHDDVTEQGVAVSVTNSERLTFLKEETESTVFATPDRPSAELSTARSRTRQVSTALDDLEKRLSTKRCVDLFTMNPRVVRLSLVPHNLPYTREVVLSIDVSIQFTPKSTGVTVTHDRGHILLLTDLLLVCEYISPEDKLDIESRADMWLCYPPLAAKRLGTVPVNDNILEVVILRKESILLQFDSTAKRDNAYTDFQRTIDSATNCELGMFLNPYSPIHIAPTRVLAGHSSHQALSSGPSIPANIAVPENESQLSVNTVLRPENPPTISGGSLPMRGSSRSPNFGPQGINGIPTTFSEEPNIQFARQLSPKGADLTLTPPLSGMDRPAVNVHPNVHNAPRTYAQEIATQDISPIHSPPPVQRVFSPQSHPGPFLQRQAINDWNMTKHIGPNPVNAPGPPSIMMHPSQVGMPPIQARAAVFMEPLHVGPTNMGRRPSTASNIFAPSLNPVFNPMDTRHHPGALPTNIYRPNSNPSLPGPLHQPHSDYSIHFPFEHAPLSSPPIIGPSNTYVPRRASNEGGYPGRPTLPSAALPHINSSNSDFNTEPSPPTSPIAAERKGPVESVEMYRTKCKIFLQQQHAQWKSLGSAKLTLYERRPTMTKQLVAESEKDKSMLISTIVLTDGVERVGKTGVAVEISNAGAHTGIVYMIQLRNDKSAAELFEKLLAGSDRGGFRG